MHGWTLKREAADDGQVIREGAVAMQFVKIGEKFAHIVERVRTLRMTRDLRNLPGRQIRVEILRELLALLGQPIDFFRNIDSGIVLNEAEFFDLRFEFSDRLLEIQKRGLHVFES